MDNTKDPFAKLRGNFQRLCMLYKKREAGQRQRREKKLELLIRHEGERKKVRFRIR
jgi:hypothetical protein